MARLRGPVSYKFRIVALAFVAAVYVLYVTLPDFGDGDSSFNTPSGKKGFFGFGRAKDKWPRSKIQYQFKANGRVAEDTNKAEEVKHVMHRTFWKYRLGAWGEDEIKPISGFGRTTRWERSSPSQCEWC